jgi:hypothetical protein
MNEPTRDYLILLKDRSMLPPAKESPMPLTDDDVAQIRDIIRDELRTALAS